MDTPRIYFAGKVEKNGYRDALLGSRSMSEGRRTTELLGHKIDYIGPFAVSCDHGCFHDDTSHGYGLNNGRPPRKCNACKKPDNDEHVSECDDPNCGLSDDCECCGTIGDEKYDYTSISAPYVVRRCLGQIYMADIVYAWVDSLDCYGTLMEIGFASALGKQVYVEVSAKLDGSNELWFMRYLPNASVHYADSPLETWPEEFDKITLTVMPFGRTMQ
jgi:hypothetical protein